MNIKTIAFLTVTTLTAIPCMLNAQEKVQLEEAKQPDILAELKGSPDGVLRIQTNLDGSFKSLVVKATVEIEDVLGGSKGKQIARKESETKCKGYLSQWLNENCVFVEAANKTVTIQTKGESSKDAAGNTVKIRNQQGQEFKMLTESSASVSQSVLRGLTVVSSDVIGDGKEFVLVMALTQKGLNQSDSVQNALNAKKSPSGTQQPTSSTGGGSADTDRPANESKINKGALNDL